MDENETTEEKALKSDIVSILFSKEFDLVEI